MPGDGEVRELEVDAPARLDTFVLAAGLPLSRRMVHDLIADGAVRVNGRRAAKGARLVAGDRVTVPWLTGLVPEPDLPIQVLHVDDEVVALDKPGGVPGHALDPRRTGTVAAFLVARWPETARVGDPFSGGLVHRLDTGTSGVLLAARAAAVFDRLRAAFRARRVTKRYLAVVAGHVAATEITQPLAHDSSDHRRMRVARAGDTAWPAVTVVEPVRSAGGRTLLQVTIRTGVTHQVRAHLASIGAAVLGDRLYGGADAGLPPARHALHATAIAIEPGILAGVSEFTSALPAELGALVPGAPD